MIWIFYCAFLRVGNSFAISHVGCARLRFDCRERCVTVAGKARGGSLNPLKHLMLVLLPVKYHLAKSCTPYLISSS